MKVLSWNCRGLGNSPTIRYLRSLIRSTRSDIVFLTETRLMTVSGTMLANKLGFDNYHFIPALTRGKGGLALLWTHAVQLQINTTSQHMIHVIITMPSVVWSAAFLYGHPHRRFRKQFWEYHTQLLLHNAYPLMCIGDFNDLLQTVDKRGGQHVYARHTTNLRQFSNTLGLMDLGFQGPAYTWTNRQAARFNIQERLDLAFSTADWLLLFPLASIHHLPRFGSDHSPILLNLFSRSVIQKRFFMFENRWTQHQDFQNIIRPIWHTTDDNSRVPFQEKIRTTKQALVRWNSRVFCRIPQLISTLNKDLVRLQAGAVTDANLVQEKNICTRLEALYQSQDCYWRQRYKQAWSSQGDRNTSFFHASVINRKRKNRVFQIITPADDQLLLELPTIQDIREVVFRMGSNKSPGHDGMNAQFYKSAWPLLEGEFCSLIQLFFSTDVLPEHCNHTLLVMIAKKNRPQHVTDYRPISLCTITYKVIAKILANRLKIFLHKCIAKNQSAFIPGRTIFDNSILVHEALHSMHASTNKDGHMAIKLDLAKAYDRVDWSFLMLMMQQFGFPPRFLNWIKICISTATFSILLNGQREGFIAPERGLRQGCPLSPYLFVFITEYLSLRLNYLQRLSLHKGVQLGRHGEWLNHLCYADDIIIFSQGKLSYIYMLKQALLDFCSVTGQLVSFDKSNVLFSNNFPSVAKQHILHLLTMTEMPPNQQYLGNHMVVKKPTWQDYSFLVDRVASRMKGWKTSLLSHAGRLILINSTLSALPNYFMSTILLPKSILRKLTALIRDFWWGFEHGTKHLYLKAWSSIELPKQSGGLGIRNLSHMNRALFMKLHWKLQTDCSSWWVSCLLKKYVRTTDIWSVQPKSYNSRLWIQIMDTKTVFQSGLRRVVQNGNNTLIYNHNWVPDYNVLLTPLSNQYFRISNTVIQTADLKVAHLYNAASQTWRMDIITMLNLPPPVLQYLYSLDLSTEADDSWAWDSADCHQYTVRSGYNFLQQLSMHAQTNVSNVAFQWNVLWNYKLIQPKIKLFIWRLLANCIPTRNRLARFVPQINATCAVCNLTVETEEHLFFDCQFTVGVWYHLGLTRFLCRLDPTLTLTQKWISIFTMLPSTDLKTLFLTALWQIWLMRNAAIFRQIKPSVQSVCASTCASISFYNSQLQSQSLNDANYMWRKPDEGTLKLNVDAAFFNNTAHIGCILRNYLGIPIHVAGKSSTLGTPLHAELWAIEEGMHILLQLGCTNAIIESDCLDAVLTLTGDLLPPWPLLPMYRRCKAILGTNTPLTLQHIGRQTNKAAHMIARHCRTTGEEFSETYQASRFHSDVIELIKLDMMV